MSPGFNSSARVDSCIRSTFGDLTINEDDSATHEQPRSLRRARSLSALLPARLASSQRVETVLEQDDDGSHPHDVRVASPRIRGCLSPISHFSLPEPFHDSADLSTSIVSPKKQARSAGSIIRRNHQDVESEHPSRLTFVYVLSIGPSSLNHFVGTQSHPVRPGYRLR